MGIPAAGKSHLTAQLAPLLSAEMLSTDLIRQAPGISRTAHLQALERRAEQVLATDQHVLVDACSVQPEQRAHWLAVAACAQTPALLLVVHVDLAQALARNRARPHRVPDHIVHRYSSQLQQALTLIDGEGWAHIEHRGGTPPQGGAVADMARDLDAFGRAYRRLCARVKAEEPSCWLCSKPIDPDAPPRTRWSFSLDHVTPRSRGGSVMDRGNARAAHYGCNSARGNRQPAPPTRTSRAW